MSCKSLELSASNVVGFFGGLEFGLYGDWLSSSRHHFKMDDPSSANLSSFWQTLIVSFIIDGELCVHLLLSFWSMKCQDFIGSLSSDGKLFKRAYSCRRTPIARFVSFYLTIIVFVTHLPGMSIRFHIYFADVVIKKHSLMRNVVPVMSLRIENVDRQRDPDIRIFLIKSQISGATKIMTAFRFPGACPLN
jgi:hypothetical protein